MAPGSAVYVGTSPSPTLSNWIQYAPGEYTESKAPLPLGQLPGPATDPSGVAWYNIVGLGDASAIARWGKKYHLHPLVIEDILNTTQRPKIEAYDNYIYLVLQMLTLDDEHHIQIEQVSLVLGDHFVLSFQEREGDVFDAVRKRLRNENGRMRKHPADYLFYALIDAVVDHYYVVLESINDRLEEHEAQFFEGSDHELTRHLYRFRRELILLRKSVWPLREVLSGLQRGDFSLISPEIRTYFRDIYDHSIQIMDAIEALKELTTSIRDMQTTEISHRLNEVMKVLTVISTIFIPLSFIAGVYGMNFAHMPELQWRYGYFLVWAIFLGVGLGLWTFFKRRKWV